ncbi:MAG TPA: hypothetical protein VHD14_17015 [Pseudolabrys sp.]|nr:hypothetical protein [Pseudolabrys sp.]
MRALTAVSFIVLTSVLPAAAQQTSQRAISDCTHFAGAHFKRRDTSFRRFVIDRASVSEDHYAAMVGNQFIPSIYSGSATYETSDGTRKVMFICLYGGVHRGAVFVYTLPR